MLETAAKPFLKICDCADPLSWTNGKITMYWALKVEKLKKKNDIQTYKEIVAFTEGKKLDELHKAVEVGKRPFKIY